MQQEPSSRLGKLKDIAAITGGAACLSSHALYNGFPLIYPDTGTYIAACMTHFVPRDRPVPYSLFMRYTSLHESLWLPMIAQCLLVSWVIFLIFRYIGRVRHPLWLHLGTIAVLTVTTGIAVNTGQLIADVFSSLLLLSGGLLLVGAGIPQTTRVVLFGLFTFALTTHLSHYPLICALLGVFFVAWFFLRKRKLFVIKFRRMVWLAVMLPVGILFTMVLNHKEDGRWRFSPGSSHVFMMNRLIQIGILDDYLDKNCATRPSTLCTHRLHIYTDFLWDDSSAINRHYGWANDGWAKAKPEYDSIIGEIFAEPQYVKQYAAASFRDAGIQLFTFHVDAMRVQLEGTAVYENIRQHYPAELDNYMAAKQQRDELRYEGINFIQEIVIGISAFIFFALLIIQRFRKILSPEMECFSWWIIAGMIFNALTVVSLAMIDGRYQARLIWVIPVLVAAFLADKETRGNIASLFHKRQSA